MTANGLYEYFLGTGAPRRRQPHPPSTGQIINPRWRKLGYPSYWHYDLLAALVFLTTIDMVNVPRARERLDLLNQRRRPAGRWAADCQWWTPPWTGSPSSPFSDSVDDRCQQATAGGPKTLGLSIGGT